LSDFLSYHDDARLDRRLFLSGVAGTGKTTYATQHLLRWLERGTPPDTILILVPQVTLGRPYQKALHDSTYAGGAVRILTLASLARALIEVYWGLIAEKMGFADPAREPVFLNVEAAQYYMARVAAPVIGDGRFGAVNVAPQRILSQVLDNLNRAAITRFPVDEIAERLIAAWGEERDKTRPKVYEAARELANAFRTECLTHTLLDFSLMMEAFAAHLLPDPHVQAFLRNTFRYVIADNVEEDSPLAHDFLLWFLHPEKGGAQGALIIYDEDGGYRNFLGADPDNAAQLETVCEEKIALRQSFIMSPPLVALGGAFNRVMGDRFEPTPTDALPESFSLGTRRFYPQMIDWAVEEAIALVKAGVPPREIAILAPYLNDSLRFSLVYKFAERARAEGVDLPTLSHRPSRALRDEPVTRALLTFAGIAHPGMGYLPPTEDVGDALSQAVDGLDPVRARLLADIVYRKKDGVASFSPFAKIKADVQERLTYTAGERFDLLREWLDSYQAQCEIEGRVPVDHFWRRLFGEVLSQPGYGFHGDLEAGRIAAQLIDSAQGFRRVLYPGTDWDWDQVGGEYIGFVNARLLPALFPQSWQDEDSNALFIAPASTFLMRNRYVDYQFWLDVGSPSWSERLEQPLTHPYVLRRDRHLDQVWTDDDEDDAQTGALYKIIIGLVRRCRKRVYFALADLGESGHEQRGLFLRKLQAALRAGTNEEAVDE